MQAAGVNQNFWEIKPRQEVKHTDTHARTHAHTPLTGSSKLESLTVFTDVQRGFEHMSIMCLSENIL